MQRLLERVEKMMIKWLCEVTLNDKSEELREWLGTVMGIVSVCDRVLQGRLRSFGHMDRKNKARTKESPYFRSTQVLASPAGMDGKRVPDGMLLISFINI
jgi:hypothetical protein